MSVNKMNLRAYITIDLEQDFGGWVPLNYSAWQEEKIVAFLTILKAYNAPLTAFVVARALREQKKKINRFIAYKTEFHLHSYSHDRKNPDSLSEITKGLKAYKDFFGKRPIGYRAPEGRISTEGLQRLSKKGFVFDASVFPSFWPHVRYLRFGREPHKLANGILEIPFTTITPFRLIFSLSWVKLLGWPLYRRILSVSRLPTIIIFNVHLHDLWPVPTSSQLPFLWRCMYSRNANNGFVIFENVLRFLQQKGYDFSTVGKIL